MKDFIRRCDPLAIGVIGLIGFCLIADFFIARSTGVNSDLVQSYNELASIRTGNVMLHGWYLATDNFYLSDLPFYILGSGIFGYSTSLIYLVPYFVFLLFLTGCILIVRRTGKTPAQRHAGSIAILLLLGFPFGPVQIVMIASTVHGAVIMYAIWGLLCAQTLLAASEPGKFPLLPLGLIAFITAGSDPQVDVYFIGPVVALTCIRLWLYPSWRANEFLLCVSVVAGAICGHLLIHFFGYFGGFHLANNYSLHFVPSIKQAVQNFGAFLLALALAFDAHPASLQGLTGQHVIAASRLIALVILCGLCLKIIWQVPRRPERGFVQLLVLGALALAAADSMSAMFAGLVADHPSPPLYAVRYVVPAYCLIALAGVVEGQEFFARLASPRWRLTAACGGSVLAGLFLCAAAQVALQRGRQPEPLAATIPVAQFLAARHLTYGVGDYWTTQLLTAYSGGRVFAGPVSKYGAGLKPFLWAGDMSNFTANRRPQFAVFKPGDIFGVTPATIISTYGKPAETDIINGYTVLILPPG